MNMKVITLVGWRRPDYFKQVVDSMINAEGIEEYKVIVSLDGGEGKQHHDKQVEMMNIVRDAGFTDYTIMLNNKNLGCAGNTGKVLREGFKEADRVIHLEDDTVLHPDALRFFEAMLEHYEHDKRIWSISGYTNGNLNKDWNLIGDWTEPNIIGLRKWFSCWGWAMWKDRFETITHWFGISNPEGNILDANEDSPDEFLDKIVLDDKGSWGIPMNHYWRAGRLEVSPSTSFVQNIGRDDATFSTPTIWDNKQFTRMFHPEQRVSEFETFFADDYLEGM